MKDFMKTCIVALFAFAIITSCNKDVGEIINKPKIDVEDPTASKPLEFNVRVDENSILKVGQPIKFIMEGNVAMVGLYSGAVGNNYDYRDTERFYKVIPKLSFDSNKTPDNNTTPNIDCAELLYTTDFNGIYTYDNIKNVNWIPITSRFYLQTQLQATSSTYAASGQVDLSDIFEEGKPVYFAWLCKTKAASNRVQFRVQNFKLNGEVAEDNTLSSQLYSQAQFGFTWYENDASATQTSNRPTSTSTLLTWNGIFNNMTGPYKEGYAISSPITLPQYNAGKDKPIVIVTKWVENELEQIYTYNKAGTYEVVFVASNLSSGTPGEIVKRINITIAP